MDQMAADASARLSAVLTAVGTRALDWTRPLPDSLDGEGVLMYAAHTEEELVDIAASAVGVLLDRERERLEAPLPAPALRLA